MRNIKKIVIKLIAIISSAVLIAIPVRAEDSSAMIADADFKNAEFVLTALDITTGDEEDPEQKVTRGLATAAIAHTLFDDVLTLGIESSFADVATDDMYAKEINQMASVGIVHGYDDGTFMPDRNAELNEILSMLITALGYRSRAEELGGFPTGYIVMASRCGITNLDLDAKTNTDVTYRDLVIMVRNYLNAYPLITTSYGSDTEYKVSQVSVMEDILSRKKLRMIEGVVNDIQRNESEPSILLIDIDGNIYECESAVDNKLLGYSVTAFVTDEDRGHLKMMALNSKRNRTLEISQKDLISISAQEVSYYNKDRAVTVSFDQVPVAIKGGVVLKSQTDADLMPINGQVILIDNNADNAYDYIRVESKEYFEVERTSSENGVIFLKEGTYSGSSLIYIDPENPNYNHRLTDATGADITLDDITPGEFISVTGSADHQNMEVSVLSLPETAMLKEIGGAYEDGIEINGDFYLFAKNASGENLVSYDDLTMNHELEFTTDNGYLIAVKETKYQEESYGFIVDAQKIGNRLSDEIVYKILDEDKNLYVGSLADSVRYNGKRINCGDVTIKTQVPIRYTINTDGKISSIDECEQYSERETRRWNEKTSVFTSLRYHAPLFITEDTKIYVVPESGKDEDYRANLRLVDQETYSMSAFDYDEETYAVGAVVVYRDITYETPGVITADAMPVMLKEKTIVLDEEENTVYRLTWLEGNDEKSYNVKSTAVMNNIVHDMNIGDVFRYSLSSIDLVDNIEILLNADDTEFFHRGANTSLESVYGLAVDGSYRILPNGSVGQFSSALTLQLQNGEERSFLIYSSEDIYYYLHDSDRKTVRAASFNDIMTDEVLPDIQASKVYIYFVDNEARTVAVVKGGK